MGKCHNLEVLNFVCWCLHAYEANKCEICIRFCDAYDLLEIEAGISLNEAAQRVMPQEGDDSTECEQFYAWLKDYQAL